MPELSYREAVRDALSRAMRDDDDVFIMGEDIAEMGGSMAVTQGMLAEFGPERLTLALDVRLDEAGTPLIATHGWTRASTLTLAAAIDRYAAAGLRHVLCTDIERDGVLKGLNLEATAALARETKIPVIASGGVASIEDVKAYTKNLVAEAHAGGAIAAEPLPDFTRWGAVDRQPMRAVSRKTAEHLSAACEARRAQAQAILPIRTYSKYSL